MSNIVETIQGLIDLGYSKEEAAKIATSSAAPAVANINTSKSLYATDTVNVQDHINKTKAAFKDAPLEKVTIARPYSKMVGGVVKVRVNGVGLALPANGLPYKVPAPLAAAFRDRLAELDVVDSVEGPIIKSDNISGYTDTAGLGEGDRKLGNVSHG